ncbi:MAG: LPS assembly protein LptD [Phycisphaerales bacterium]
MPTAAFRRHAARVPMALGAAALVSLCGAPASVLIAQPEIAGNTDTDAAFTGRDFGGIELPATPQRLALSFSGMRGWSWREGNGGVCSRLFFEKDVRINVGPYRFVADRASVWLEPVTINGVAGEQLALYLENARDPAGPGELEVDGTPSPSGPWLSQQAARLLVTALVVTDANAPTTVAVDVPMRDARPSDPFVTEGEIRLARYLADVTARQDERARAAADPSRAVWSGPTIRGADRATQSDAGPLPEAVGAPPTGPGGRDLSVDTRSARGGSPIAVRTAPIIAREGVIEFYSPNPKLVEIDPASDAAKTGATRALMLNGGVTVQYETLGRRQSVLLEAARAVVFLARAPGGGEGADAGMKFSQGDVLGIYLEGDAQVSVRTRPDAAAAGFQPDQYVLRGSRMYYDVSRNSAVVLDAVFWTYDQERGMPLYLRADVLRQRSLQEFTAEKATLANVSFAEPHFAIGASSVTVTRDTSGEGRAFNTYEARDLVFTAGGVPLAYVPKVSGEFKPSPLRRIEFESVSSTSVVRTVWDMYTLLGLNAPEGSRWDLLLDWYISRGVGIGTDLRWTRPDMDGSLLAYYLNDQGKDHLSSGADRDPPQENRGIFAADNIWKLDEHWTLFAEGTYISDEAFVDSFFRREAQTRREFTNSLYLRRLEDNEAITAEIRGTFNDFISNQYLLTSQGYQVQKLPDFAYHRVGEDLFGGLLSYTADARFSATSLVFDSPTLADHGYDTRERSLAGFGLLPTDRLSRVLESSGLDEDTVTRFDTRHDIEAPLSVGPVNVTPFAVGRFTAYDTSFDRFNDAGGAGNEEGVERERLWGAAGVRAATSLNRVDSSVESDVLDLHGIRHIITPSLTAWSSGTNVEQSDLPVYDEGVESLADGTTVRAGIENVWQTHRPGTAPGAQGTLRSVDWLRLNTDYVWSSGDVDRETPFGRFIEARPERSSLGEFITADAIMQLTDAVALTGDVLFDVEEGSTSRTAAGTIIDHGDGFSTFVEYRSLDQLSSKNIDFGARYELTRKYAATIQSVYDLDAEEFQSVGGRLTRRFPQWTVEVGFHISTITDESSIGFVLSPVGASGETRRRIFTREFDDVAPTNKQRDAVRDRLDAGPFAD